MSSDDETQYPSVDLAYMFVQPSYQFLLSRFEAADNRLTALLTVVVTVTLGVPLFAKNVRADASFDSPWFVAGLMAFVCAAAFGVIGRSTGSVTLVNPKILYNENLHKSQWTFKKDALYRAGQHFETNVAAVAMKGTYAAIVSAAVLMEVVLFAMWLLA